MENEKKTKLCPYCKSIIDRNAVLCVKCGKILPKKKMSCLTFIMVIVLVFAFFGLIGSISEDESPTNSETKVENENKTESKTEEKKEEKKEETKKPEINYASVSVNALVQALEENALKAEKTYQDAYVEITGVLDVIDSDGEYISLEPSDTMFSFLDVQCFIKNEEQLDKVLEMKVGDTVTLKGQITSIGEIIGYHLDIHSIY